jgi:dTDP-4-amino-4,6-dideoxygalactose transaminase
MDKINDLADKYDLFVVEDCALAMGTYFKGIHAGLHGDTGCFSFYPVKHMTTAEGGMLITRRAEIAEKISRQRAFGVDRHVGERKIPGVYDVNMLGFNYRMNEIEAVLGLEQIKRMDGFLEKRKKNYETLSEGLTAIDGISLFESSHGEYQSSYYCLSILLDGSLSAKRFEIIQYMKEKNVGTSVYYPQAVPHFSYYRDKYGYDDKSFPVASRISASSIALPVGPHLDEGDMEYIVETVKGAISEIK